MLEMLCSDFYEGVIRNPSRVVNARYCPTIYSPSVYNRHNHGRVVLFQDCFVQMVWSCQEQCATTSSSVRNTRPLTGSSIRPDTLQVIPRISDVRTVSAPGLFEIFVSCQKLLINFRDNCCSILIEANYLFNSALIYF